MSSKIKKKNNLLVVEAAAAVAVYRFCRTFIIIISNLHYMRVMIYVPGVYACAVQSLENDLVRARNQLTQYADEITELKSTVQTLSSTVQSLKV